MHDEIEPNPGTALIEQGSTALRRFAADPGDLVVVALGGGSTMDSGKVIALHATNDRDVLSLGYHDESLKGRMKGQRSIRLNKGYRAYYRIVKDTVEFVRVERVDKHVY